MDIVAPSVVVSGQKTIAAAGTQEAIAASGVCRSVTVKALATNTGNVFIGASTVSSADGFILSAGESVSLAINSLATVYIDVAVNGEGVSYIAVR